MCQAPVSASVTNHSAITGPKKVATLPVPRLWTMNSPTRTASVIGTT